MMQLREEYGIYGVGDGRINIAGLQEKDIQDPQLQSHTLAR